MSTQINYVVILTVSSSALGEDIERAVDFIQKCANNGGATCLFNILKDEGYNLERISTDILEADSHYLVAFACALLPVDRWMDAFILLGRSFLSGAYYDGDTVHLSFYGSDEEIKFFKYVTNNSKLLDTFTVSLDPDYENEDEDY